MQIVPLRGMQDEVVAEVTGSGGGQVFTKSQGPGVHSPAGHPLRCNAIAVDLAQTAMALQGEALWAVHVHRVAARGPDPRVDGFGLAGGYCAGSRVVAACGDDSLGIRGDGAVIQEDVDMVFAANRTAILPWRTKYGRLMRALVSVTSGSAAST